MGSRYLLNKILQAIGTIFFIVILNFVLFRMMPGSPDRVLLRNPNVTTEVREAARERWGLDEPLVPIQLVKYIAATAQGDLGFSFSTSGQPVTEVLAEPDLADAHPVRARRGPRDRPRPGARARTRAGNAAARSTTSATARRSCSTRCRTSSSACSCSALRDGPRLVPDLRDARRSASSTARSGSSSCDFARHLVLPVMTVAIGLIGQYSILMRSSVIETLGEDYVTTARAKGLSDGAILRDHALPNALLPTVTLIAINLGFVIGGAITVEVVFNWPGLGHAHGRRRLPPATTRCCRASSCCSSISVVVANLIADLLYGRLDPRVRT